MDSPFRTPAAEPSRHKATLAFVLPSEQFPNTELVELGVLAEQAGFDAVWTSDHFQPWQDNQGHASFAWVTLAALGQRTSRILLGTGVTCPSFRYHPTIVAQAFASLGTLYPGRVFLGVGAGEALNEVAAGGGWGSWAERGGRLAEAVELIRRLWTGEWVEFHGRYYSVPHARLYDVPRQPIPIYMAASGPKSMYLAGHYGDGLVTDGERALKPELRQTFEQGARAAGKDPRTMPILAETMVVAGSQEEARRYAPIWQFMPHSWDRYVGDPDPVDIERRARRDVKVDELIQKWPIGEDPQVHVQAIQQLIDGGVTHVFIHSPQADLRGVIEFYGRDVLPKLATTLSGSGTGEVAGAR